MSQPTSTMSFRPAQYSDVDAVRELINRAFREAEGFFVDGDRITAEGVRGLLAEGNFILAEGASGLEGCVLVEIKGERAYFGLLSVDPSRQRDGLGRRLIGAVEDLARKAGCKFMDLRVVNLRTELTAYYERLGYEQTGTEPFPHEVETKLPCYFILMSKPLTAAPDASVRG
jgi:predicted N-acetyltransferase YhbS